MIGAFKSYNYYLLQEPNIYGERQVTSDIVGSVKMSIFLLNQQLTNTLVYKNATYIGITYDKNINDNYIIDFNGKKLKVLYVSQEGRKTQVFLGESI